jgi:SAM-dependent methyltransferase
MLEALRRLIEHPLGYDVMQRLAGQSRLHARLRFQLDRLSVDARVVDLGGGTGSLRSLISSERYVCLDPDALKLRWFKRRNPQGFAIVGDAARCPLMTSSVDAVLCTLVAHHLRPAELDCALTESERILRRGGVLLLVDALWSSRRWIGRVLWACDRGSYPKTEVEIRNALPSGFAVEIWERWTIPGRHEFVTCFARRV